MIESLLQQEAIQPLTGYTYDDGFSESEVARLNDTAYPAPACCR